MTYTTENLTNTIAPFIVVTIFGSLPNSFRGMPLARSAEATLGFQKSLKNRTGIPGMGT